MKTYFLCFIVCMLFSFSIQAEENIFPDNNTFQKKEFLSHRKSEKKETEFFSEKETGEEITQDEQAQASSWFDPIGGDNTLSFEETPELVLLIFSGLFIAYVKKKRKKISS
ncbi:MAG: hypothetical protein LUG18_08190 [Candidatus Azobacteroides sp.]|nr:hypothetical protein [Candidatus Azobacteroides sp.]